MLKFFVIFDLLLANIYPTSSYTVLSSFDYAYPLRRKKLLWYKLTADAVRLE